MAATIGWGTYWRDHTHKPRVSRHSGSGLSPQSSATSPVDGAAPAGPVTAPKKRGRPPKPADQTFVDTVANIQSEPRAPGNFVEFEFSFPIIFKYIHSYLKFLAVENINIHFDRDHIRFTCVDHPHETFIDIHIDCNKAAHYFCKEPITVTVIRSNLEVALGTIRPKDSLIQFVINEDERNAFLQVIVINGVYDNMEALYKIELVTPLEQPLVPLTYEVSSVLNFTLIGKQLKQICADRNSNLLTFLQESPEDNLQINSINRDKKVQTFKNMVNQEIQLQSMLEGDQTFRLTLPVDKFKHLGKAFLNYNIRFWLDNSQFRKAEVDIHDVIKITVLSIDKAI